MPGKQPQILDIDPPTDIVFQGPFSEVVTTTMKLSNPSDKRVGFKVKTTAPKRYCVRPNSGFLDSGASSNILIMLQPRDPDAVDKGKHKFMVQSLPASPADTDIDAMWAASSPGDLMDTKLKCIFEGEGAEDVVKTSVMPGMASPGGMDSSSKASEYLTSGADGQAQAAARKKRTMTIVAVVGLVVILAVGFMMMEE